MAQFVRIVVDSEAENSILSGLRVDLNNVIAYKVENLNIKLINIAGGAMLLTFSEQSAMLRVLNYLDTTLSVNLNPIS
jgi:hypothetical protein